jgi:hypothetical protein
MPAIFHTEHEFRYQLPYLPISIPLTRKFAILIVGLFQHTAGEHLGGLHVSHASVLELRCSTRGEVLTGFDHLRKSDSHLQQQY